MRYVGPAPPRLDIAKLKAFLGSEPYTPLDPAITTTGVARY